MARYSGPIVDVDIHHRWARDEEIVQYLPERWQNYVRANPLGAFPLRPPGTSLGFNVGTSNSARRLDSFGADGSPPGSSYAMLKDQLLDKHGYFRGILTHDVGDVSSPNQYFAREVSRAVNDWNIETWLTCDDRLYSGAVVSLSEPEEAAKEIRRVGAHPRIVSVVVAGNPLGRPYGDPLYHPIYEAATELGLTIDIHVSNADYPTGEITSVGGPPGSYMQTVTSFSQSAMHHISSFIVHGVFEKYPGLTILVKEYGVAWIPSVMAQLDKSYDLLRLESPWVKRWPSEYIHDNIRISTQPIEESPDRDGLVNLLQAVDGVEDILCFSTDYPHWSYDDPAYVARLLPSAWTRKVFCENACRAYGWEIPSDATSAMPASAEA